MSDSIFRKKSVDRASSPDSLNDYIRVAGPGVWLLLAAVAVLLAGFIVWGLAGRLETVASAAAISDGSGTVTLYVKEADFDSLKEGQTVRVDGDEAVIDSLPSAPVALDGGFGAYALHVGGFSEGEWAYPVTVSMEKEQGVYEAGIVTDSVSPISFLLN